MDEHQLGRNPTSAFAIVGDRTFSAAGTGSPPGHPHGNLTKQTAIVDLMDILQLACRATMRTQALSVGQPGDLLLHDFGLQAILLSPAPGSGPEIARKDFDSI